MYPFFSSDRARILFIANMMLKYVEPRLAHVHRSSFEGIEGKDEESSIERLFNTLCLSEGVSTLMEHRAKKLSLRLLEHADASAASSSVDSVDDSDDKNNDVSEKNLFMDLKNPPTTDSDATTATDAITPFVASNMF